MVTPTPQPWITFVRTRHAYDSYVDFFRLVEAAGFPTVYVDEMDLSRRNCVYIFTPMNGELPPHLDRGRDRGCKVVWWNLERPTDPTHPASINALDSTVDAIWVSDRYYQTLHPRYEYVQLAGHRALAGPTAWQKGEKLWDICTLSYLWGRREDAVKKLEAQGLTVAPSAFGAEEQDNTLPACRVMLSLHQYMDLPVIAPLRFAIAASYKLPIISERFEDKLAGILVLASGSLHELVGGAKGGMIKGLLHPRTHDRLAQAGERLYDMLCVKTDFRKEVEAGVARFAS